MWRRLKNLWELSNYNPKQYNIGFKWTSVKAVNSVPSKPATIVEDNQIKTELDNND